MAAGFSMGAPFARNASEACVLDLHGAAVRPRVFGLLGVVSRFLVDGLGGDRKRADVAVKPEPRHFPPRSKPRTFAAKSDTSAS